MRVYKYPLPLGDVVSVFMPADAVVLCVQVQHGMPCIWAMVHDPDTALLERKFRIAGTGHVPPDNVGRYIGTFQLAGGNLMFHLFEAE